VEDPADLRQLMALGVTHAQGYLLGRPGSWHGSPAAPPAPILLP
jgi:EAL domain-containing protein (putative c-di-GMP-specific phosphodiesterase class I)